MFEQGKKESGAGSLSVATLELVGGPKSVCIPHSSACVSRRVDVQLTSDANGSPVKIRITDALWGAVGWLLSAAHGIGKTERCGRAESEFEGGLSRVQQR